MTTQQPWFTEVGFDAMTDGAVPTPRPRVARRRLRTIVAWCAARVGVDDVLVAVGLLLVSRGCWLWSPALGWFVPGAIVLWYALPQRPRFLEPSPPRPERLLPPERRGGAAHGAPQ